MVMLGCCDGGGRWHRRSDVDRHRHLERADPIGSQMPRAHAVQSHEIVVVPARTVHGARADELDDRVQHIVGHLHIFLGVVAERLRAVLLAVAAMLHDHDHIHPLRIVRLLWVGRPLIERLGRYCFYKRRYCFSASTPYEWRF